MSSLIQTTNLNAFNLPLNNIQNVGLAFKSKNDLLDYEGFDLWKFLQQTLITWLQIKV